MRFAFIDAWKEVWSVEFLCGIMQVTSRGFRAWRDGPMSQRQRDDMVLLAHVREQHRLSLQSYGRPRVTEELPELGLNVGPGRVGRLMRDLAIRALDMAVALRQPPEGCIHHTDRGSQYCSNEYQRRLSKHGFKVSMSGKGNCYDNSMVETFFKSIKAELIWRNRWDTRRQAEGAIFQYINGFYNPRRRHSSLGGKSPLAFERKTA